MYQGWMLKDVYDLAPWQMIYPCMFYRMTSFECGLCRYGSGRSVREAIVKTLESVLRGLIQKRRTIDGHLIFTEKFFQPNHPNRKMDKNQKNESKLVNLARYLEKEFIIRGLENRTDAKTCFGLLKRGNQFICGPHNIWFRSTYQEVIPFLLESSEGTYGCLCYLAALVTRELL